MKTKNNYLEKKKEKVIYLTLDLEKDYGTALKKDNFYALEKCKDLITFLEKYNIPLTVFIQTKILEKNLFPDCLLNSNLQIEYGVHSYSHMIGNGLNHQEEIQLSTELFKSYFNKKPLGYRAPNGVISKKYLNELKKLGYLYDSSFIPSWRIKRFTNKPVKTKPFLIDDGLIEIPFSVCSNLFAIPVSLSYFKLIGKSYQKIYLTMSENSRVIFNIHLHDLINPIKSYSKLSFFYKIIYIRNFNKGFEIFKKFILTYKKEGISFDILSNYAKELLNKYGKLDLTKKIALTKSHLLSV